ncbi:hypothetical protein KUTeg_002435 [Tegillarca granosa]|uniref:Uncharacterized protein n=1 Tax=Tegillarca granosa TaxID=220873 RepID=A0ABQ9FYS8_TEGGR|nr:hypothetical protein KUTeg_002435 [Tegillarca granosa]
MLRNICFVFGRNFARCKRIRYPLNSSCMSKTTVTNEISENRKFSTSSKLLCDSEDGNNRMLKSVKLMDTNFYVFPGPFKLYRAFYSQMYIKLFYNNSFSIREVVKGATQALLYISDLLSKGEFEPLEQLIEPKALEEIKSNYSKLSMKQRDFLRVKQGDLFRKFLYDLKLRKDWKTGKVYADALVVFHGFHGFSEIDLSGMNPLKDVQKHPEKAYTSQRIDQRAR